MTGIHLMRPEWLWCLAPALVLAALLWRQRQRGGSWGEVIEPALLKYLVAGDGGGRSRNLVPWLLAAWVLAVFAASGPSLQKIPQPVVQKQDALVIVLDLSYSMKSGDLAPSRIDRARQKIVDLLARRQEGQTGLIAFAGDAHIVTPLTDDTRTITNLLPALNPDMMPVPGSDPVAGIAEAVSLLDSAGINGGRILLVGDAITRGQREPLAEVLVNSGAALSIMGVGTETGAPIPLPGGGFLKDESEAIVMPALDEGTLKSAARMLEGRYMRLQIDDSDLDYLLAEDRLPRAGEMLAMDRSADAWEDQGHLLLLLVMPLVLALFRRGWVACTLPLLVLAMPEQARAGLWDDLWYTPDQQGQKALQQGDPQAAASLFEDPDWAGVASYRAGDYETAKQAFSGQDSADGWYNRGNALARSGQFAEAIDAYRRSLERAPDRADALENIALLEQLQQQAQENQQGQGEPADDQQNQQQGRDDAAGDQQDQQPGQGETSGRPQDAPAENGDGQQPKSADRADPATGQSDENGAPPEPAPASTTEQQPGDNGQTRQPEAAETDSPDSRSDEQRQAQAAPVDAEQEERDQAMEQWLRRVPDDPSGLLREKFRYQSQQRQRGESSRDAQYW